MNKAQYFSYYREDKETHKKDYLRTNMFNDPALEWVASIDQADKYSSYDSFLNNAKAFKLEDLVDVDKYVYDFEEVA